MDTEIIEALNNIAKHDWFDYITLISGVIFTYLNIKYVNKNTNKQIENQNKETYRPRLILKSIKDTNKNTGERYLYAHSLGFKEDEEKAYIHFNIELENIGYGIANDISFYMLNSGSKCLEIQFNENTINQKLKSTIEIQKDKKEIVPFEVNFNKKLVNSKTDGFENDDAVLLICNYKDLNNNNYKILIGCILKRYEGIKTEYVPEDDDIKVSTDINYDFYYYQEGTEAYEGMVNKKIYKRNYKKILKEINK